MNNQQPPAMIHLQARCSANDFSSGWPAPVQDFWQQLQHGTLQNERGQTLHYYFHLVPDANTAIVLSNGRIEMASKYSEVMYDIVGAGCSVFILDHCGQGQSDRLLDDRQKGHIQHFDHYSADWHQFVEQVVQSHSHQRLIALCHSMGSAIFCNYLLNYPTHPFVGAVLCSPMLGIYTAGIPMPLLIPGVAAIHWLDQLARPQSSYLTGQGPYKPQPFQQNRLTSCQMRYQWFQSIYQAEPGLQLGGVTLSWLIAAWQVIQRLQQEGSSIQLPLLVLQAKADKVVSNGYQRRFVKQRPSSRQLIGMDGARHELLMEQDAIRARCYHAINAFINSLPS
ncbi:alpha/beta fold hydrolase [Alkalimonas collagenimarina]|uniref:Alpha/beta fold hydrolase n=1 Tax=Alkalimonas collagenimarina TaxID=400390 RepID=A0ABT9GVT0_9GAMM|nr:alpha/beta fold hydrolase [Alkalimonas collagenimarina]MDP4535058.1 alpha/beta fold hydrolase [Alkalimonas collagenimarina]